MKEKRRCSGLSKGWWWLLTLLGLPLLYFLMLSAKWDVIEKDIQTRTSKQLDSAQLNWANIEIKKRGRDVLLHGTASSETERKQAIESAKLVRGVRIVEDDIKVIKYSSPHFSFISNNNHKITLAGIMPSQENIKTLVNSATKIYGVANVENKLTTGERIASPSWITDIQPLMTDLKGVKNASLDLSDTTHKISGIVRTKESKTALLSRFTALFGDKVIDEISIQALKNPSLDINYTNGKVTLTGILGSQKSIDKIINKVSDKIGKDNVINHLTLDDNFAISNGSLNLSGEATSKDSYQLVTSLIKQTGKSLGFTIKDDLILNDLEAIAAKEAEAERLAQEKAAAEKAEAERLAQEKVAAEKAEAERLAQEKAAAEKAEAERLAQEKATAEKAEAERLAQEKAAAKKAEAERLAQEKAAAEKAEAERLAQEKAAAEKAEAKRLAQEKAAAEKAFSKQLAEQKLLEEKEIAACQTRLNQLMAGKTILFETNKANIKRASFSLLNNIAETINGCRGKVSNSKIEVSGHTDSRGSDAYNLQLSQRRADAVKSYLTKKGVGQNIITSKGYGETQPVASNDTADGRRKNRRITFSVQ